MDHKTVKVLLVEDNIDYITLVQKILSDAEVAHFELIDVDRLSKAKQRLAEGSIDVVLLDLGLPDSQGLNSFLKVHAQAPGVPIVVLTASDSDALALEAMRQGAQDYLVKGQVESNLLVRAICYAIERRRAEEEKKNLEAQLRQSQKMEAIGTLAGGIAHEFNNILWVIMGNTEMSLRKLAKDSPIRAKQQEILTASKRAQELIEQILTFSRHREQERKPLQIPLIVQETLKLLEATLPSTTKIRQNIDKDCGTVMADPTEIQQMVMNLCTNAYHAMGEKGGLLEVSLGILNVDSKTRRSYTELQEGSYVQVTISDTGCGMDEATVERVFDPFFTTKEVDKGTGLGLATVHGIVRSMGGAIRVYSEPGEGSTFRVLLPRHDFSVSEPMAEADSPVLKGNERVLYVDDEKQIVSIVQDMLEELGYHITTQTSSVEALKQFRTQPDNFDLVITDQTMPDMTGIELADQILHIRPDIPVILATGYSKLVTEEKIKNIGIRESLSKPIVFHDLETVVRRVLDDKKDE